jgi:hypothetical protein
MSRLFSTLSARITRCDPMAACWRLVVAFAALGWMSSCASNHRPPSSRVDPSPSATVSPTANVETFTSRSMVPTTTALLDEGTPEVAVGVEVLTVTVTVVRGGHTVMMSSEQRCAPSTPAEPSTQAEPSALPAQSLAPPAEPLAQTCETLIAPVSVDGVADATTARRYVGPASRLPLAISRTVAAQRLPSLNGSWMITVDATSAREIFAATVAQSVAAINGPFTTTIEGDGPQWTSATMKAPDVGWSLSIARRID